MPVCSICGTEYWRESEYDPADPCVCGETVHPGDSAWDYDGWNGVRNWLRYRVIGLWDSYYYRRMVDWAYKPYKRSC